MHTRKQGLKFLYAGFGKIKGNPVAVTRNRHGFLRADAHLLIERGRVYQCGVNLVSALCVEVVVPGTPMLRVIQTVDDYLWERNDLAPEFHSNSSLLSFLKSGT